MYKLRDSPLLPLNFPLIAALFEGGLALLAVALGWLLGVRPLDTLVWDKPLWWICPLSVLPLLMMLVLFIWWPVGPLAGILRTLDQQIVPMFKGSNVIDLAVIALLAGLGEEMLFRGVLQAATANWIIDRSALGLSPHEVFLLANGVALLAVSLLFGLAHFVTLGYAVLAALIGFYLGALWLATGNLAVPIFAHAIYDFVALVYVVSIRPRRHFEAEA